MGEIGSGGGSGYPAALDTNTVIEVDSPAAGKTKARADVPNDLAAAVVAIETELGVNPAGSKTDLVTRLNVVTETDGTMSADVVLTTPKVNVINEETAVTGVTVDSVLLIDGAVSQAVLTQCIPGASPSPPGKNTLYRESMCKGYARFTGATPPVINDSYNVTGVARTSAGIFVVTWDLDFDNASHTVNITVASVGGGGDVISGYVSVQAADTLTLITVNSGGTATDPALVYVTAFGTKA